MSLILLKIQIIYFPTLKYVYCSYTLGKIYQCSFSKNSICPSKPLILIHLNLLKLFILLYKWVITFINNYLFYCNIVFSI